MPETTRGEWVSAREHGAATKPCPLCAEVIQAAAVLCRHCGAKSTVNGWLAGSTAASGTVTGFNVGSRVNGMAIAGFVLGLIGALTGLIPILFIGAFLFAILGMVFSVIGVRRASRPEFDAHRKLAIAGVVLSIVAFILGGVGVAIVNSVVNDVDKSFDEIGAELSDIGDEVDEAAEEFESYAETIPTEVSSEPELRDFTTLAVGSCFNEPDDDDLAEVVPCDEPHQFEMLTKFDLWTPRSSPDNYPGDAAIEREGDRRCDEAFRSYVGISYDDSRYAYYQWYPDSERWADGLGEGMCAVGIDGQTLTGSAEGAGE